MKRLILTFSLLILLCNASFVFAEKNQEIDNSTYLQELNVVRKNLIEFKRDFYTYKIQSEKEGKLGKTLIDENNSEINLLHLFLIFFLNLGVIFFFVWFIIKRLKSKDQGLEKRLESQKNHLYEIEQKIKMINLNSLKEKGLKLKLIKEGEELLDVKNSFAELLEDLLNSYSELVKKYPENDKYFYEKAQTEAYLDRKVSAIHDLKKAIRLNPKWKEKAKTSFYFKSIRNFNEFKKITAS